jgi:hypothetical protein
VTSVAVALVMAAVSSLLILNMGNATPCNRRPGFQLVSSSSMIISLAHRSIPPTGTQP